MKGIFTSYNFFSKAVFDEILADMNASIASKDALFNSKQWSDPVVEYSKPIDIKKLDKGQKNYQSIKNQIYETIGRFPDGIYYYFWGPGSYIPWHSDDIYSSAFTIYMNEGWNYEDGGLFQYNNNNKIETIIPEANTAVMQTGNIPHSTTILSRHAPIRKSIQVWFEKDNDKPTKSIL